MERSKGKEASFESANYNVKVSGNEDGGLDHSNYKIEKLTKRKEFRSINDLESNQRIKLPPYSSF